jgi:hypothetical protein
MLLAIPAKIMVMVLARRQWPAIEINDLHVVMPYLSSKWVLDLYIFVCRL